MRKDLLDGIFAFGYGLAVCFAWWFVVMIAFGEYHPLTVWMVYSAGIPISAVFGLAFGTSRGENASIAAACVGWVLSLFFSPTAAQLFNPANSSTKDRASSLILLALAFAAGVYGIWSGRRFSRDHDRKHFAHLGIAAVLVTAAVVLVFTYCGL
jgi:hypothetical protein